MALILRDVTGIIKKASGAEWAGAELFFELVATETESDVVIPKRQFTVYAGAQGAFSVSLYTIEGEFLNYTVRLPNAEEYTFSLPGEAGAITLASLITVEAEAQEIAIRPATETSLGGVMVDGVTIIVDENGVISAVGGTGGVSDHGALSGLADDDHPHYLNNARGDARYFTQAQTTSALAGKQDTLVNQVNIKSINNQSLLGAGNVSISSAAGLLEFLSNYANLTAALDAIGDNKTLIADRDEDLTDGVLIRPTVRLAQANGAQITITGAGSVVFEGEGLADALNPRGLFKCTDAVQGVETRSFYLNAAADSMTRAGHGFVTGQLVRYEVTSGNAIPGLTDGDFYYLSISGDVIKFHDSYADAVAGTPAVDITGTGDEGDQGMLHYAPLAFTGNICPPAIASELIDTDNNSLTDRLKILVNALVGLSAEFHCFPRTIDSPFEGGDGQSLYFLAGDHPNTFDSSVYAGKIPFLMGSYSTFRSQPGAFIFEPDVSGGRTTAIVRTKDGGEYIKIIRNHFKHSPNAVFNSSATTAAIQNASNCIIADNVFEGCRAYHAGVIVSGYTPGVGNNFNSHDNIVTRNLCTDYMTQNLFIIGGYNNELSYNRLLLRGAPLNAYSTAIDVEPNTQYDEVFSCRIIGNEIDLRDVYLENSSPVQYINTIGILIQNLYTNGIYDIKVIDNKIIGWSDDCNAPQSFVASGIQFDGGYDFEIARNLLQYCDIRTVQARRAWIHHNELTSGRIILTSPADHRVEDNWAQEHYSNTFGNLLSGKYAEDEEIFKPFTSDGVEVSLYWQNSIHPEGDAYQYFKGLYVEFNNALHRIMSVSTNEDDLFRRHMTLDPVIPATAIATAPAGNFDATNNEITTDANHNLLTGGIVFFIQDGASVAPAELPTYNEYWIIKTADNKFKMAGSKADALANNPINFSPGATGTFQFIPTLRLRFTDVKLSNNHFNGGEKTGIGESGYELLADGDSQILSTFTTNKTTEVADANFNAVHNSGRIAYTSLTAPRTVNLYSASGVKGLRVTVSDRSGNAGTHNITLEPNGSETVNGAANLAVDTDYGSVTIESDGANWFVIN